MQSADRLILEALLHGHTIWTYHIVQEVSTPSVLASLAICVYTGFMAVWATSGVKLGIRRS